MNKVAADTNPSPKRMLAVIGPGSPDSRGIWREIKEQKGWLSVAVMPQDAAQRGLMNPPDAGWDAVITVTRWDVRVLSRLLANVGGIIGDEGSIDVADKVAEALDLPHNDPKSSALRYDKAEMTRALRQKGLPVPATFPVASVAEANNAAKTIGYPLVIKLPASCAGDCFTVCQDFRELEAALQQAFGQRSLLGDVVDVVLIQELLTGPVYTVNCITLAAGEHWVLDVWRDIHYKGGAAYERSDLLDTHDPLYVPLTERAKEVLDVTGFEWGPGHIEMMQNTAGEWVIIDLAARVGGWYPQVIRLAHGVTPGPGQAEAAVLALTDPNGLRRRLKKRPVPHGKVTLLWMLVPRAGTTIDAAVLKKILKLPGVLGVIDGRPGAANSRLASRAVSETTNLMNQVGAWPIAGPLDVVEATVEKIRELEERRADGLYRPPRSGGRRGSRLRDKS